MTASIRRAAHLAMLGLVVCAHGATPPSTPGAIHLSADFTRDGRPEDITIEFLQQDIQKSFSWVLSIRNADGKIIYFDPHDDEGLEEVFSEPESAGDCSGYEQCKRRYYFTLLPRNLGRCLAPSAAPFLDEKWKEERLEQAARFDLRNRSLDASRITAAIAEMKVTLGKAGYVSLCVPEGPDLMGPPMIWVEAVQQFVTYYRP